MKEMTEARFIRRYKRFLADVRLTDGTVLTVHCPNTGSMKNCTDVDQLVWLSMSDSPKRKYRYTWEYIRNGRGHMIGVNTGFANNLVLEAVREGRIKELSCYEKFFREVRYGKENSRIDLLLRSSNRIDCYVEVKSVTLLEQPVSKGIGYFPDAVSARGAKHLRELELMALTGYRAVLFFCIQHTGIRQVRPADHIDTRYGELLRQVAASGVEIVAYKARMTQGGFKLSRAVPVDLR